MRRAHILRKRVKADYPQQCIWFDTESRMTIVDLDPYENPGVQYWDSHTDIPRVEGTRVYHWLKFGFACYMRKHRDGEWTDEQWLRFDTPDEFWIFAESKCRPKTKLYLLCHNTSFDLPILRVFRSLNNRGFTLRSAIIDAPPTILRFTRNSECIMILDTLNFFRMPLKILGKEIGLQKHDMPEDNDLGITWDTYGKRDVEIIRDACVSWWGFLQQNGYGSFAPTLAGQAMRVFRHKYMAHQILIDDNERAIKLSREGYYGGRTEAFRIGRFQGRFSLLDVNSMYPSVMEKEQFPYRLVSHTKHASIVDLQNWLPTHALVGRFIIHTNDAFCPIRKDNKLVFPVGTFSCILSTPEIEYAIHHDCILKIQEVAVYNKAPLFRAMMQDLYQKRVEAKQAGEKVQAFIFRKLMNSFYGKWGQSGGKWEDIGNIEDLSAMRWTELDLETGKVIQHRRFGGLQQRRSDEAESRDSFTAIAGHVTAFARMELFNYIEQAGRASVYYCDTDSLLVDNIGRRNLDKYTDSSRLGYLSVKGEYEQIQIWGAKDYQFGTSSKTKGVKKDAVWIGSNTVLQQQWSGLRGLVSSGNDNRPVTLTARKTLKRIYDKGTVLPHGKVEPYLMTLSD